MKKLPFLFLSGIWISILVPIFCTETTIQFDSSSGNYVIRYKGSEGEQLQAIYEPSNRIDPQIQITVEKFDNRNSLYSYSIRNSKASLQNILVFSLISDAPITEAEKPSNWFFLRSEAQHSFLWMPRDVYAPGNAIEPGKQVLFKFYSDFLPGIIESQIQGVTSLKNGAYPEEPPEEVYELLKPIREKNEYVTRTTVGPKTPPTDDVTKLLEILMELKNQSSSLGWLTGNSLLENTGNFLGKGMEAFLNDKHYVARLWLERINQLLEKEKQKGSKNLTDNGYYLLKPNIDFILTKLPAEPKNDAEKKEADKVRKNAR